MIFFYEPDTIISIEIIVIVLMLSKKGWTELLVWLVLSAFSIISIHSEWSFSLFGFPEWQQSEWEIILRVVGVATLFVLGTRMGGYLFFLSVFAFLFSLRYDTSDEASEAFYFNLFCYGAAGLAYCLFLTYLGRLEGPKGLFTSENDTRKEIKESEKIHTIRDFKEESKQLAKSRSRKLDEIAKHQATKDSLMRGRQQLLTDMSVSSGDNHYASLELRRADAAISEEERAIAQCERELTEIQ